jgi:Flp pilus assembly CpaF family ATPase
MGPRMLRFLSACIRGRANTIVSGGAGSGKTTLLGILSAFIPDERLITIEDAAELRLAKPHVVSLEARSANVEAREKSPSVTSSATLCACGPIASSSARLEEARLSTCSRL